MKRSFLLRSTLCIATLAASLFAVSADAQLLTNGGFESGDFTGWTLNDPSGFTGIGSDAAFAHNGSAHYAYLSTDITPDPVTPFSSLSQTFNTTPGTTYTFSFFLAHDVSPSLGNSIDVLWNGGSVFSQTNMAIQDYTTGSYSFDLPATGPSTTILFSFQDRDDAFRLDDVSVTAAVPEPSTVSFVALGLGFLGLTCYRRAKARRA
jgi:hypothetical protein